MTSNCSPASRKACTWISNPHPLENLTKDKREFLADVTAFANAAGGDLVFGVSTRDGVAAQVEGIELDDPDKRSSGSVT